MSEIVADLKAFTPAAPDRDAVLFAAGRASAPRRGVWKWVAGVLAVSNAVTLAVLLWPKVEPIPVAPVEPPVVEPAPFRPDPSSYIALTWGLEQPISDAGQRPAFPAAPLTPRAINDPNW